MGSFLFQGSNDGRKWTTLLEVSREKATVMYCSWNLAQASDPFRYFRILMTSPTSSNSRRVCMKNFTLHGSIFYNGKPYKEANSPQMQPAKLQQEQIRPTVVHVSPVSGGSSEHVMQICDSSLTNLIHTVANMVWIVSSTQGLAATIASYKIEPPKALLSHGCSAALSDIVALVSQTSDTFLESIFSYLAEMLVELSVGGKNAHIYRLFLFGRNKNSSPPYMKVHTYTQKLANKLAAVISDNDMRNLQFMTTICFKINVHSPAELQRSKNQMEGIAEMARKGMPVSRLPPFDVSSLVEFNIRREVHVFCCQNMPGSLVQHVELNSESNKSVYMKAPVTDANVSFPPDRMAALEAKLSASLLREHELQAKLNSVNESPVRISSRPKSTGSAIGRSLAVNGDVAAMYDAKIRNLQQELQEAAKREEALKNAPYFGTNPTESFDVAQLKQKLLDITNQLAQRDKTINEMAGQFAQQQDQMRDLTSSAVTDRHVPDSVVSTMQAKIDGLLEELSSLKSELKLSTQREIESLQLTSMAQNAQSDVDVIHSKTDDASRKLIASLQEKLQAQTDINQSLSTAATSDDASRELIASLQEKLQAQTDINQSLSTAATSRDKQVRDLEMQVARLQAKLQDSYDEVDEIRSQQTPSILTDRVAELEIELEQAALREENLQQMMVSWSSEDDKRRIRDLERELIVSKRKEEELRNAPPPPLPAEIIEKIRSLEENLTKATELAQSFKRKLEVSLLDAKQRSETWAVTEAELRSACLQWSPEVDRKRIVDLQQMVNDAKEREEALHNLLQQKPKMSKEEEAEMERMKQLLLEQQLRVTHAQEALLAAPTKEQLIAGEQMIEELKARIKMLGDGELILQHKIESLNLTVLDKNSEIDKTLETLEQREASAKSREEYLMFEISQLKERLPENRDEVIENLKLVKADAIEKTRLQKAEIQELQKLRVDLEHETRLKLEAEAKIKQLESKSKEQKKLFDAEKVMNLDFQSKITELELVIHQDKQRSSLDGLPPSQKDHKLEAMMLNSKRRIVGLDKEKRAAQEKEKESTRRNQDLKTQASKAQAKMQQAVESEQEMQIRLESLSQCTSYEAKVASTIVDSLSVAAEQRVLALESERDAIKLQEQAMLKQLEEMEHKVAQFEKTKQAAQANESQLAMEVTKLRKLVEMAHSANSVDSDSLKDVANIQGAYNPEDPDAFLQTTLVQEYVQSEISKAKVELQAVLEGEFSATLAEFESRKGDAVHTAFIKADETVVQRIQDFVDEKAEIMKHMTYLTRAHADSNMAAKLAEEKLTKLEPATSQRDPAKSSHNLRAKPTNTSAALPPIKMGDAHVGPADSFPRRLLSVGTSPMPGARSANAGTGVGFVSEEVPIQAVAMSPYAQTSAAAPLALVAAEIGEDFRAQSPTASVEGARIIAFEEQLAAEKKKVSKLAASLKAAQDEKIALQVELATQRHLTDVCQEELEFLRKQTKRGFLPRFLDKSPTRPERVEKDLEIRDDVEDAVRLSDFKPSRTTSGPVQFVLDRGSSQKFAGVSINTMKKLNSDDLQRIKAYSPNLFKSDKKKPSKPADASEDFKSEFNYPKSRFEQLADEWMFDEPSIKKRQEKMMLQEHLQSLKNKAMKQQAILFAVASKQGVKVPGVQ